MKFLLLILAMATGHQEWQTPWYDDDTFYESESECLTAFSQMKFDKPEKGFIAGFCIPANSFRVTSPDNYREPKEDPK